MLTLLICASCASPAALSSRAASVERVKAPIVNSAGALPPRAAERVVAQRLGDLREADHVRELIDAFRKSAAAPLVAGNRVTLLVEDGREEAWRDTHVQIEGPAAAQFQTLFLKIWERAGGKTAAASAQYFPPLAPTGAELVAAVASNGGDRHETKIYDTYVAAIGHASQRLWMTQAYFAPDASLRTALIAAARRGVDVRVIVPSFSDSALIFHASRADYDELLAGGVRIYEQRYAMLHAKTMVIDSALSMVGSANFDIRSFLHNNEVNAVVVGTEFAQRMEALFERDLGDTRELKLESWRKRPLLDRFKEFTSSLFSYWL